MKVSNGVKTNPFAQAFFPKTVNQRENGNNKKSTGKDSMMISEEARARLVGDRQRKSTSMIENLMEQRQKVQEAKNDLIGRTLEAGKDLATVKEELAVFDEQMAEIDGQISTIKMQKREQEQREREEKIKEAVPTEQSAEKVQMTSMLKASHSLDQVSALKQVKVPIENAHRRLKTELKNDGERGVFLEGKAKEIQGLKGHIRNIDGEMMNQIGKAREAAEEMNEKASVEEGQEKEETTTHTHK